MGWFNHQLGNIAHEWYHRRETSFLRLPRLEICRIEDDEAQRLTGWWLRRALSMRICTSNMAWLVVDYKCFTCRFAYMMLTILSIFAFTFEKTSEFGFLKNSFQTTRSKLKRWDSKHTGGCPWQKTMMERTLGPLGLGLSEMHASKAHLFLLLVGLPWTKQNVLVFLFCILMHTWYLKIMILFYL